MDRFLYKFTSMFQSEKAVYHKVVLLIIKIFILQGGSTFWQKVQKERL